MIYHALNIFFFVFHLSLIGFNLSGWAVKAWRKWHLATVTLTAFSWFALGYFYGWGYCFLTDWHYDARRELGLVVDSSSYIHFMLKRVGMDFWSARVTDIITSVAFAAVTILTIVLNIADYRKKSKAG